MKHFGRLHTSQLAALAALAEYQRTADRQASRWVEAELAAHLRTEPSFLFQVRREHGSMIVNGVRLIGIV